MPWSQSARVLAGVLLLSSMGAVLFVIVAVVSHL